MKTRIFATTLALLLAAGAARAQELWKEGRFGDKITGDIHRIDESDIFVDEVIAGSEMKVLLKPARKSNYRAVVGMYAPEEDFTSLPVLIRQNPDKPPNPNKPVLQVKTLWTPMTETGKYRVRVLTQSEDDLAFSGEYSLRVKIKVNRKYAATVPIPEGGEGIAEFSAHAGSVLNLVIKAGPGTDLPTLTDLVDPDGNSLLVGAEIKLSKKAIQVKKLALATFGVYRVKVQGEAFKSFRFTAKVKPPKRKWEKVDVRDLAPPPLPLLILSRTGDREPFVQIRGQQGGTNRYLFTPRDTSANEYVNDAPAGLVFNTTDIVRVDGLTLSYRRVSSSGEFEALVSEMAYDAEPLLLSFRTDVKVPDGDGLSLFSEITRDGAGSVTGYEEIRTFGEEGVDPAHTLVFSDIERLPAAGQVRYRVQYTDPDGNSTTYVYPPWRLTD